MLHHIIQEVLESPETNRRPDAKVLFLLSLHTIAIGGRSLENTKIKMKKVIQRMEQHLQQKENIDFYFAFQTFDFQTLGYLFRIIKQLNKYHLLGKEVHIYWSFVSNEEMIEAGLELRTFCDFPFEVIGLGGFPVSYWSQAS